MHMLLETSLNFSVTDNLLIILKQYEIIFSLGLAGGFFGWLVGWLVGF